MVHFLWIVLNEKMIRLELDKRAQDQGRIKQGGGFV